METSINQIIYDKKVLEGKITQLLVDFTQAYPGIKLDVDISFIECKDEASKVVSTCVSTNVNIRI